MSPKPKPDAGAAVTIPPMERHEELDLALRQAAQNISTAFLAFCDLAKAAITEKIYERFGCLGPVPYFERRLGLSYRSVRRWMTIHEAIERLPDGDRLEARAAISALGSHKAGVLAPVLGAADGTDWRTWLQRAQDMSEDDLQMEVSASTGSPRRGLGPEDRFLRLVLANMPPDVADHVEAVFHAVMRAGEITNPVAAFLVMVDMVARDLGDQGIKT